MVAWVALSSLLKNDRYGTLNALNTLGDKAWQA
jgi:hypothetical protein